MKKPLLVLLALSSASSLFALPPTLAEQADALIASIHGEPQYKNGVPINESARLTSPEKMLIYVNRFWVLQDGRRAFGKFAEINWFTKIVNLEINKKTYQVRLAALSDDCQDFIHKQWPEASRIRLARFELEAMIAERTPPLTPPPSQVSRAEERDPEREYSGGSSNRSRINRMESQRQDERIQERFDKINGY